MSDIEKRITDGIRHATRQLNNKKTRVACEAAGRKAAYETCLRLIRAKEIRHGR